MTLTKEWLLKTISELEEERDATPGAVNEDAAMALAAMKMALASLGAEPVGYFYADRPGDWYQISDGDRVPDHRRIPLYSSPQSGPVVKLPNEFISNEGIVVQIEKVMAVLAVAGIRYERKGNACLATMLQGAEPVTTAYKLPANTPCKDAPEHIWLQTAGVWPENGEFSELTWCSDNQHQDDTLYVRADVVSGNYPVIPDGLRLALSNAGIAAPESDEMLAATCEKYIQELVTWVKDRKPFRSAAPQQEVK